MNIHRCSLALTGVVGAAIIAAACSHDVASPQAATSADQGFFNVTGSGRALPAPTEAPFARAGAVLRSENAVRAIAVEAEGVHASWGGRKGPDTATAAIRTGGGDLGLAAGALRADGTSALRGIAPGVEEKVEATPSFYRRSWTFAERPADGTIEVTLAVRADALVGVDGQGAHYENDGAGFRIGNATWIDANGARFDAQTIAKSGSLTFRVPADVVARSAFPAVLDPDVGPEWAIAAAPQGAADQNASVLSAPFLPSGRFATVASSSSSPDFNNGTFWVQVLDPTADPPTLIAAATVKGPVPPAKPIGAKCGSDDCLAFAYVDNGSVFLRRFSLATMAWLDASGVQLSNALNDAPANYAAVLVDFDGSHYAACWDDQATGADAPRCVTVDGATLAVTGTVSLPALAAGESLNNGVLTRAGAKFGLAYTTVKDWVTSAPLGAVFDGATGALAAAQPVALGTDGRLDNGTPWLNNGYGNANAGDVPVTFVSNGTGFWFTGGTIGNPSWNDPSYVRSISVTATELKTDGTLAASPVTLWSGTVSTDNYSLNGRLFTANVGSRGALFDFIYSDDGTNYWAFNAVELAPGASAATELASGLPSFVQSDGGNGKYLTITDGYVSPVVYDAGANKYIGRGGFTSHVVYKNRPSVNAAYDSAGNTFFLAWVEPYGPSGDAGASAWATKLAVNAYAPGSSTPKNAEPVYLSPGGTNTSDYALWSIDAALGNALVTYVATKSNNSKIVVAQRVKSDGTLFDASPGIIGNLTGVDELVTSHSQTKYYVSQHGGSPAAWHTYIVDPSAGSVSGTEVANAPGIPFGSAVGGAMPVYIPQSSGNPHVGIADSSNGLAIIKDLTADSASWDPRPDSNGLALASGKGSIVAVYTPSSCGGGGGSGGGYGSGIIFDGACPTRCVLVSPSGTVGAPMLCSPGLAPVSFSSGSRAGRTIAPITSAAGKFLSVDTQADPPVVKRWLVESTGQPQAPDLPFPAPVRRTVPSSVGSDYFDYSAPLVGIQGGSSYALAFYAGNWTTPAKDTGVDVYARWVQPGFVAGSTCASNDECDSKQCVSNKCKDLCAGKTCGGDQCNADGVCDAATGECVTVHPYADGTRCSDDGNDCTDDKCVAGVCSHPASQDGSSCTADTNDCTRDICSAGACTHPNAANGTSCSGDGNPCTADTCTAGLCGHAAATSQAGQSCFADSCHVNTTCDGHAALCSASSGSNAPDGTGCFVGTCGDGSSCDAHSGACPDDSVCTVGACSAGACVAGSGGSGGSDGGTGGAGGGAAGAGGGTGGAGGGAAGADGGTGGAGGGAAGAGGGTGGAGGGAAGAGGGTGGAGGMTGIDGGTDGGAAGNADGGTAGAGGTAAVDAGTEAGAGGGATGGGGSTGGTGGATDSDAGASAPAAAAEDSSGGCGCVVAGGEPQSGSTSRYAFGLAAVAGLAARRRRRR